MDSLFRKSRKAEQKTSGHVEQNLEAILAMHVSAEQAATRPQKMVEKLVATVAVPAFLIGTMLTIGAWVALNLALLYMHRHVLDHPPFGGMQAVVSLLSLTVAMLVVITQNRQGKVAELNARLDLQVNLLVDQKVSKIIKLLEEMRSDSPTLANRRDHEAEALQEAVDPENLAARIADKLSSSLSDAIEDAVDNG
jgi:uncharacterized membrane protein